MVCIRLRKYVVSSKRKVFRLRVTNRMKITNDFPTINELNHFHSSVLHYYGVIHKPLGQNFGCF